MQMNIKTKLVIAAIPLVLLIIFILQNIETVNVRFLFVDMAMPRALLIFLILVIVIAVGILFRSAIVEYLEQKLRF